MNFRLVSKNCKSQGLRVHNRSATQELQGWSSLLPVDPKPYKKKAYGQHGGSGARRSRSIKRIISWDMRYAGIIQSYI